MHYFWDIFSCWGNWLNLHTELFYLAAKMCPNLFWYEIYIKIVDLFNVFVSFTQGDSEVL